MNEPKNNQQSDITPTKATKDNLMQQFHEMESQVSPPPELKEEVFSTLDTLDLLVDIADLFTVKFTETEATILEAMTRDEENGEKTQ